MKDFLLYMGVLVLLISMAVLHIKKPPRELGPLPVGSTTIEDKVATIPIPHTEGEPIILEREVWVYITSTRYSKDYHPMGSYRFSLGDGTTFSNLDRIVENKSFWVPNTRTELIFNDNIEPQSIVGSFCTVRVTDNLPVSCVYKNQIIVPTNTVILSKASIGPSRIEMYPLRIRQLEDHFYALKELGSWNPRDYPN